MTHRLLIVEDEKALRETLAYNLTNEGYAVDVCADGLEAVKRAQVNSYDLILLDIMLPGLNGFEVCKQIRQKHNTPILMLTARDDEIDRVVGLEVGADDYMGKPFSLRELIARVKAMLRRSQINAEVHDSVSAQGNPNEELVFDTLVIDTVRREVRLANIILEMKPKEYDLLLFFAQNRGRALTRDRILADVWGWDYSGESRTVDVHIRWLREKIENNPAKPTRLVTVRGSGYRFEG
jgi:DNA-binding response OmpR family regulator